MVTAETTVDAEAGAVTGAGADDLTDEAAELLATELAADLTEEAITDEWADVAAATELRTELAELTIDEALELASVGELIADAPEEVPAGTELLWVPRDGPGIGLSTVAEPVAEAGTVVGTVAEATLLTETGVEDEEELELELEAAGQLRS